MAWMESSFGFGNRRYGGQGYLDLVLHNVRLGSFFVQVFNYSVL